MKNYFDKYIKYKNKYIKIKNQLYSQVGGELYDCSDKKNTKEICEIKPEGQWDNLEECTRSRICIENNRLINSNQPPNEVIQLLRKNKKLLENVGIYNEHKNFVENSTIINLKLEIIDLLIKTKDFIDHYKIYSESELKDILQNNDKYEEENLLLVKSNLQVINLIKKNPILSKHAEYRDYNLLKYMTNTDKIYKDINDLKEFYKTCMRTIIPKTFYISGLCRFAVYKDIDSNKIIYLLGEHHIYDGTCPFNLGVNSLETYNANNFFHKLITHFIKDKHAHNSSNKLDIFLEENYYPESKNKLFRGSISPKFTKGFLEDTMNDLYTKNCKPLTLKNNYYKEKIDNFNKKIKIRTLQQNTDKINKIFNKKYNICLYDPYVRFHYSDMRSSYDKFIEYVSDIFWLYYDDEDKTIDYFNKKYSNIYNEINLLDLFNKSEFLKKLIKQIANIRLTNHKYAYFISKYEDFRISYIQLIASKKLNYDYIVQNFLKIDINEKIQIIDIYCYIMDLYLMARIYRSFDIDTKLNSSYESTNIIIYAGDYHIENIIKHFHELKLQQIYMFTYSDEKYELCTKVNNFNVEFNL